MARGIGTLQTTDIDPTTVHDETVTVIIERGMIDVEEMTEENEMIDATGPGGPAPDIVIAGMNPAGSILHTTIDDGMLPLHRPSRTMVHRVLQGLLIRIEKKASEYRFDAYIRSYVSLTRIYLGYLPLLPASRPQQIRKHILR